MKFEIPEQTNYEYSGIWKTIRELKQIANRAHNGTGKNKMIDEIRYISIGLVSSDDVTNLTIKQAKLFGFIR